MRAPAIKVEVEVCRVSGDVLDSRVVRFVRTSDSMRRKGRYLLPVDKGGVVVPFCLRLFDSSCSGCRRDSDA